MHELYRTNKLLVLHLNETDFFTGIKTWRDCELTLSSVTFGIANTRVWKFAISYDPIYNFNCEQPEHSDHAATVRSALHGRDLPPDESKINLSEAEWEQLKATEVGQENGKFYRPPWDLPCRPVDYDATYYVHPEEDRLFHFSELNQLAGVGWDFYSQIPQPILDFVKRQIEFYEQDAWGEDDFGGWYDPNRGFIEDEISTDEPKRFRFDLLRSQYVHPLSQRKGFDK